MANQPAAPGLIQAETRRRLPLVSYEENRTKVLDLPRDTVLKRIEVRLFGSFEVTYAAGAPVADVTGSASRLCPRLDVVVDGSRTIKSVDIYLLEKEQQMLIGILGERAYTKDIVGAPTTQLATVETPYGVPFAMSATTKYTVINESFMIYFEMPFAYSFGREATMLNLKGASSAELRFNFGSISNLLAFGSDAVDAWANINLYFACTLIEAQDVPREQGFFDYRESVKRVQFSAESRDALIDLPKGNMLAGLFLLVRNGDATKALSDIALKDIQLVLNGQRTLIKSTFLELQQSNRLRYGVDAKKDAGVHSMQGFAFINLLKNGDIRTALDCSPAAGVDNVQLQVTTAASAGVDAATYTNPVELTIMTQEIIRPQAR